MKGNRGRGRNVERQNHQKQKQTEIKQKEILIMKTTEQDRDDISNNYLQKLRQRYK